MPGATAGLADVGAVDAEPLEVLGRREHHAQQLAVVGLDPGALGEGEARLGGTVGQLVSDPLQPAEVEDSWDGRGGGDATLDLNPAEPLRDQLGELALEATDLPAQLMARQVLVDPYARKAVSVEQFRHRPSRPV
ncbi:MAG TPA: hypothetical protein VNB59_03845 [Solirubrobacterales bacterium]|nr:hypothetical protein [Solirubrobacterales bacterium]